LRWLLSLLLLVLLLAAAAYEAVRLRWEAPLDVPAGGFPLTVTAGESLRSVSEGLAASGVLDHPLLLQAYARWQGVDASIKRGEYLLPQGITAPELLGLLQSGRVVQYQVTLPEGITLARALQILAADEVLVAELEGIDDARVTALADPHGSPEGLFFPDSYRFERGASDWDVLQRAHQAMRSVLAQEWAGRAAELPYETPYEALIMASIVERETGLPEERGAIAGVFVRRLLRGMRLQTDPTVIYGLGERFDGNLTRTPLRDESNPYNTYRHGGLPPTPIALPGRAAIHAALHPGEGGALYFVARGDGGHAFSDTLEARQQAVRKYQLNRSKNYRSTRETPQ
jgi:UPF0755 protein